MSQPAVSRHLRVLRDAGLSQSHGRTRACWTLGRGGGRWLQPYRRLWAARLDSLARHLDEMDDRQDGKDSWPIPNAPGAGLRGAGARRRRGDAALHQARASAAKVWRALTEAEHLAAWFPTTVEGDYAVAGAPLRFSFREVPLPANRRHRCWRSSRRSCWSSSGATRRLRFELTARRRRDRCWASPPRSPRSARRPETALAGTSAWTSWATSLDGRTASVDITTTDGGLVHPRVRGQVRRRGRDRRAAGGVGRHLRAGLTAQARCRRAACRRPAAARYTAPAGRMLRPAGFRRAKRSDEVRPSLAISSCTIASCSSSSRLASRGRQRPRSSGMLSRKKIDPAEADPVPRPPLSEEPSASAERAPPVAPVRRDRTS